MILKEPNKYKKGESDPWYGPDYGVDGPALIWVRWGGFGDYEFKVVDSVPQAYRDAVKEYGTEVGFSICMAHFPREVLEERKAMYDALYF